MLSTTKIDEINLQLTYSCNMNCKLNYCHLQDIRYKSSHRMSEETGKKAIDLFVSILDHNKSKKGSVYLLGGEPLLHYSLLNRIVRYIAIKYSKRVRQGGLDVKIITNGILLDIDTFVSLTNFNVHYKLPYFINIGVSFDGDPMFQRINRGKSGLVEYNLKKIKKFYAKISASEKEFRKLQILWTLTPGGITQFYNSCRYLMEDLQIQEFVDRLFLIFAYCIDWPPAKVEVIKEQTKKAILYLIEKKTHLSKLTVNPLLNFQKKIANWRELYFETCQDPTQMRCPKNFFFILPDGSIVRCDKMYVSSLFKTTNNFRSGNIRDINPHEKDDIRELLYRLESSHHKSLFDMLPDLKTKVLTRKLPSQILSKSNRLCFFRYDDATSMANYFLCQKAFLQTITLFLKRFKG